MLHVMLWDWFFISCGAGFGYIVASLLHASKLTYEDGRADGLGLGKQEGFRDGYDEARKNQLCISEAKLNIASNEGYAEGHEDGFNEALHECGFVELVLEEGPDLTRHMFDDVQAGAQVYDWKKKLS